MSVTIRLLTPEDKAAWHRLWAAYIDFYQVQLGREEAQILFERLVTGKLHFAFVAELDGTIVGFVHGLPHASTWSLEGYCYLEDLFVDENARGAGIGRALIHAVYEEADRRGLSRVYWHTDEGNATARSLYDTLATKSDFVQYRR